MYIIEGRRWFERTNGNTYHSVNVYDDNKLIGSVNFRYGYGDQYIQTGIEILEKAGLTDSSRNWQYENRDKYHASVCDVSRKKDL
jgi:hypothetical protein